MYFKLISSYKVKMCFYVETDIVLGDRFRIEFRSELFVERTDIRMYSNVRRHCTGKAVDNPPCYFGNIKLVSAERLCLISRTIWQKETSVAFANFSRTEYTRSLGERLVFCHFNFRLRRCCSLERGGYFNIFFFQLCVETICTVRRA